MKKTYLAIALALSMVLSACQTTSQTATTNPTLDATNSTPTLDSTVSATTSHGTSVSEPVGEILLNSDQSNYLYQTTLANGLKVIIKPDHRAPIVMTQIWYDVGSSDEPMGKGGLSHFLEHLMFKDTPLISGDDYHRLIAHFGGDKNAFTSYDYTAYFESLPANQYPIALQIEANRMKNILFKPEEIITEKKVVQEERRLRTDDDPTDLAYEVFRQAVLPHSPKARPVIGAMSDIEGLSFDDLHQWYQTWYSPNNATLVLVGDIDPTEAMVWVRRYFDDIPASTLPARQDLSQNTHRGYHHSYTEQAVQVPMIIMGFNTPSISTNAKDAYALSLLNDIADGGLSARFESNLIRKKQLFDSIGSDFEFIQKGDGVLMIIATPKAGVKLQDAEQAILAQLDEIITGEIGDDELKRGQTNLASSLIFANDSIAEQAQTLGMLSSLNLPLDTLDNLPKTLATVSKDDIKQVGQKYLSKDNLTTVYVIPKGTLQNYQSK